MKKSKPPLELSKSSFVSGENLLEKILDYYNIQYGFTIETLSNQEIKSYEFLNDFVSFTKSINDRIVIPCIPYETGIGLAVRDLELGLSYLKKSALDIIPYIEFYFPNDYDCINGNDYKHIYMFFITQYEDFNRSCEHVNYLLNKFAQYKIFL